jgi:hypothetical protein
LPLHEESGRIIGAFEVIADQTAVRCSAAARVPLP